MGFPAQNLSGENDMQSQAFMDKVFLGFMLQIASRILYACTQKLPVTDALWKDFLECPPKTLYLNV